MKHGISLVSGVAILVWLVVPVSANTPRQALQSPPVTPLLSTPLMFVENAGQFAPEVRFQARDAGATLWLTDDALWITLLETPPPRAPRLDRTQTGPPNGEDTAPPRGVNLKLTFVGTNPHVRLEAADPVATHVSYFRGSDPARWRSDVPAWSTVRYRDLYPGIDLELGGSAASGPLRLIARPGADLEAVRLRIEGADGLALEPGRVCVTTILGIYELPMPELEVPDFSRGSIKASLLTGDQILRPFAPPGANRGPLRSAAGLAPQAGVLDLVFSTFLGGSDSDNAVAMAADATGAIYLTGYTISTDFPTTPGAFDRTLGGYQDAFVAKLSGNGSALIYSTFLGGTDWDRGHGIVVDATGAAYVMGPTNSNDFPTTPGAYSRVNHSGDVFITKLNASGSTLVYSTFLGGQWEDCPVDAGWCALAIDATGHAYVAGTTASGDFPTTPGVPQPGCANLYSTDAFITKLNTDGSDLVYSTCLGGSDYDRGTGIAVDAAGAAYVVGETLSQNFPVTPGAFDTIYNGGTYWGDGFVVKVHPDGSQWDYATYLGGSGDDCEWDTCRVVVDAMGAAFVAGTTWSSDYPTTPGAFDTTYAGGDGFVTKLNPTGTALVYSTFLGGSDSDEALAVAIDPSGAAYVTGYTPSPDFPTTPDAYDPVFGGGLAAFAAQLSADGSNLDYSTFLHGSQNAIGIAVAVDASGAIRVAGHTNSPDFPTTPGAYDRSLNGDFDVFVAEIVPDMQVWMYLPVVRR